ncbi:hypothetical protein C8J57DRAFT_1492152 [Mycena rebaudengoi]|nr:hypothetical protein C8J57DRAFT_1492152 [Mycena rebaudengoi]
MSLPPCFAIAALFSLEVGNAFLLEVALRELGLGTPAQLGRFTVIISSPHFQSFYLACLSSFRFADSDPPYGLPFMPISQLYILHAAVEHPTFTHLSSIDATTVVRLPYNHCMVWTDLVRLLDFSGLLRVLIIDALHFDFIPASILSILLFAASTPWRTCLVMSSFLSFIPSASGSPSTRNGDRRACSGMVT